MQDPKLKAIARKPEMPGVGAPPPATLVSKRDSRTASWLGALVRNVVGLGEVSAGGLPGETGVMVLEVPAGSRAQQAGLRSGDVILKLDGKEPTHSRTCCGWGRRPKADRSSPSIANTGTSN